MEVIRLFNKSFLEDYLKMPSLCPEFLLKNSSWKVNKILFQVFDYEQKKPVGVKVLQFSNSWRKDAGFREKKAGSPKLKSTRPSFRYEVNNNIWAVKTSWLIM